MKFPKLILTIGIILSIVILCSTSVKANNNIEIYLDGQRIDIADSPQIINGRVLLPMRSLFEMFYLDVHWDHNNRTVETVIGDRRIKIQINNNQVSHTHFNWHSDEWHEQFNIVDQPPILINGKTYMPLRFIAETLDFMVTWDDETRNVSINRPIFFRDGSWFAFDGFWSSRTLTPPNELIYRPLDESIDMYWNYRGIDNLIFIKIPIDTGASGWGHLYMLDNNGRSRLIHTTGCQIANIKMDDNFIYMLKFQRSPWTPTSSIFRIQLDNPSDRIRLGDNSFSYGRSIRLNEIAETSEFWLEGTGYGFEIREDGVFTTGYNASLILEGRLSPDSLDFLKQSYGYYLLPRDGGTPILMENIMLEAEKDKHFFNGLLSILINYFYMLIVVSVGLFLLYMKGIYSKNKPTDQGE